MGRLVFPRPRDKAKNARSELDRLSWALKRCPIHHVLQCRTASKCSHTDLAQYFACTFKCNLLLNLFFTVCAALPWKCQLYSRLIEIMVACGSLPCVRFSRFSCLAARAGGFAELSVVWMPPPAPDSLGGVLFTSRQPFIGSKGLLWST